MTDELNKAQDLLLNKTFTQKRGSGFKNHVTDVSINPTNNEILVGYKTVNHDKKTSGFMGLSQFIGSHIIDFPMGTNT